MNAIAHPIIATDLGGAECAGHVHWFLGGRMPEFFDLLSHEAARTWPADAGYGWLARVLSNGCFYLVPDIEHEVCVIDRPIGFASLLAPDSAGLALTLRCLDLLGDRSNCAKAITLACRLREYARQHPSRDLIERASAQ